jgi:hypothetical protein
VPNYSSKLQREDVLTASIRAAKKVTAPRFGKAALVAALLSTLGAAQGMAGAMPDNCNQNLDQCSQIVWGHNSFAHRGDRQSITFSNGMILTCTSNGRDIPRSCALNEGQAKAAPAQETHAKEAPAKVRAKSNPSAKAPNQSNPSGAF